MISELPQPIDRYFAGKNAGDVAAAMAAFSPSATVRDERRSYRTADEIRTWLEDTHRRYHDTAEITAVALDGDAVRVTALVSGTFPGSPLSLRFAFTLDGGRIGRLEITA